MFLCCYTQREESGNQEPDQQLLIGFNSYFSSGVTFEMNCQKVCVLSSTSREPNLKAKSLKKERKEKTRKEKKEITSC